MTEQDFMDRLIGRIDDYALDVVNIDYEDRTLVVETDEGKRFRISVEDIT